MKNTLWHILLVEENDDDRAELRQKLVLGSERRYRFTEAKLGAEALQKAYDKPDGPYECIILSYYLPDMNSEEILAVLCEGTELPPCPVVVVIGAVKDKGPALLRAGAQDYIGKHRITPESLTRAVENSVERFVLLRERMHTLQALKASEERLALGVQVAGLGLADIDYTTGMAHLSAEAAQMFGFGNVKLTLPRAAIHASFHPDDRADVMQCIAHALSPRGTRTFLMDHRVVWPNGQVRWLRVRKHIRFAGEGNFQQPQHATLVALDVTTEKTAEQALRDSEEQFRALLEAAPDAIVIVDEQGLIVLVNALTISLFGYSRAELLGEPVEMLMPSRFRHLHSNLRDGYLTEPQPREMDGGLNLFGKRKDGSEFPIEVSLSPLETKKGRLVSSAIRDITERKRIEAELNKAKAAAENANRAKSDFLSSMSHELRSPLNAILGFAQLLEAGTPPLTPRQKTSIDQILHAGWYLLELINEILDLAMIESGKISLSLESISLSDVLDDCQAMIEPQAQTSGISMSYPPFDDTCIVNADRTRVKQVFLNLLSNAIKYNRAGGTIAVTYSQNTTERIRISVHDTGEGLSADKLEQLFQPFNRLGQENGLEEGTGIGLVVSKRLIELMGGHIGVESTVGVGSVFWVELVRPTFSGPVIIAPLPAEVTPNAQEDKLLFTLLYVEDNPTNLLLVEQIITNHKNIKMLSAKTGRIGVTLARIHHPDIILMDINLPGISGIDTLNILREDPATADIPVIALSANAMPGDIQRGLQAGFFRYLTKPIKINEFINALDDVLTCSETGLSAIHKPDNDHD
ncbi:PAS domain S-box protein [Methylovulum psychrotolerans]|nr:PAS domain S-box protein [Methylovulum psychrotolerans]